ncbi:MAG: cytidine deaminase [Mycoplasmataceae bacterium]|jgi:cytidine deaminase|nr:cytidine deaminase [Mycoplasmataceae bacterium]
MTNKYQELKKIINNAYAPYSKFKVAAIVETDKGDFYGVNVENASFPISMCAERNAIYSAVAHGAKKFKSVYLLSSSLATNVTPCGACRQVINEFFAPDAKIYVYSKDGKVKTYSVQELLPYGFKLKGK